MNIGDRVKLIPNIFIESDDNPINDFNGKTIGGTIIGIQSYTDDDDFIISVKWDNDLCNIYRTRDLELYKDKESQWYVDLKELIKKELEI